MAALSSRHSSNIPSLRWPLLFALLAAIVFFVGASTVRETYRGWKVDQEIEGLKSQVSQLEGQKHSMTELLGTMKTDAYIEQEARLRFNLKKPGEQVVLFEEGELNARMAWTEQGSATSSVASPTNAAVSIPKRWLEYFINPRQTRS
jgi:cell division protein FtsB